jgi:predicted ATPase
MLSGFSVGNYRAFASEQRIALRPLTLFFGWNSGGKSSLLRLLPLIAESLNVRSRPIWLGGEVGRRAMWPDLVCKATESDQLRISLEWDDEQFSKAQWVISGDLNGAWQEVREFVLDDMQLSLSAAEFDGILPHPDDGGERFNSFKEMLLQLPSEVQWLQGLRKKPERLTQYGGGPARMIRPDGADAVDHLIEAFLSRDVTVTEEVQKFFSGLNEDLSFDNPANGVWRLWLCPKNQPATRVRVALCDTGEGYSQVLPVLIALARAKHHGPRLLCLEQPELHLHTRAQAQLAQQLVSSATSATSPRILVETHSEVLLSSIQLAIVQGQIKADDVQVYWVESREDGTGSAMPVNFNANGEPDSSLLAGAFGEALRIGQQLVEAQLRNNPLFAGITITPSGEGVAK